MVRTTSCDLASWDWRVGIQELHIISFFDKSISLRRIESIENLLGIFKGDYITLGTQE